MMYVVDQSKQCAQIYLPKNTCCLKLQLLILYFVKSLISDMHYRITYMYINFQQNQVVDQSKPCTLIYLHNIYRKLYKLATTNGNFFKKLITPDLCPRKTYTYINFQQNRVSRSVKTVHTNLFAKICKLHKFATCN